MAIYHPMEHVGWAAYIAPKLIRANGDWWFAKYVLDNPNIAFALASAWQLCCCSLSDV
jgi:hypothetical protein